MGADVGGAFQQEPGAAHGRVEDFILQSRLHQLHDHGDDMPRGAELSVVSSGGNLAQQVLIDIAHDILVVHVQRINITNDLRENPGCGNQKHRILHITAECSIFAFSDCLDEGEHISLDVDQHFTRLKVMEHVPAKISVLRFNKRIFIDHAHAVLKDLIGQWDAQNISIRLRLELVVVQQLHEHQVGYLFENRNRTGNASCPDGKPNGINLAFEFASNHDVKIF